MLRVTATMDYAVRAVVAIAGNGGAPLSAAAIAAREQLPHRFLAGVLASLRKAHLLESRTGGDGGYWLARPAADITLGDLVRAVEGSTHDTTSRCSPDTAALWAGVTATIDTTFDSISVQDVLACLER